jgi:hypothetical protein
MAALTVRTVPLIVLKVHVIVQTYSTSDSTDSTCDSTNVQYIWQH